MNNSERKDIREVIEALERISRWDVWDVQELSLSTAIAPELHRLRRLAETPKTPHTVGRWCLREDVDAIITERAALTARNAALTGLLRRWLELPLGWYVDRRRALIEETERALAQQEGRG